MTGTETQTRAAEATRAGGPEEQLRATLDSLLDPHVLVRPARDPAGRAVDFICVEANDAALDHFGRAHDEVVGARLADLLPPALHTGLLESLVETLETGRPLVLEDHAATVDPLEPERRFDLRVIRIGRALSCTWSDVTQRHEIEASLRRRVAELDVMHRISQTLAEGTDLGEAIETARREVARLFRASSVTACLLPEEADATGEACLLDVDAGDTVPPDAEVLVAAALTRRVAVEGACAGERQCRVLAAPMLTRGRAAGVLAIVRDGTGRSFAPREMTVAQSIADSLGAAVESERLQRRERRQAAAGERQRLARELHDSATQTLYSANLIAEVLPASWQRGREEGLQDTRRLGQLMRTALCEMRTLLYELRPETLDAASLGDLLERLGEALHGQGEAAVEVFADEDVDLPVDVKLVFYRVAQEALTNVAKHAHAARVRVDVTQQDGTVILTVCDDGRGFDAAQVRPGTLGLRSMRERAEGAGGDLEIVSVEGEGTMVTMTWPGSGAGQATR